MSYVEQLEHALAQWPSFTEVGCMRRNEWTKGDTPYWGILRARALLEQVANPVVSHHPPFSRGTVWRTREGDYISLRAGAWKDYWWKDFLQEVVLSRQSTSPTRLIMLHEERGGLQEVVYEPTKDAMGEALEAVSLRRRQLEQTGTPPRIAKNGEHNALCFSCPVRQKCNSVDVQQGDTQDWPSKWLEL